MQPDISPSPDCVRCRRIPATWKQGSWWRTDVPEHCYQATGHTHVAWELAHDSTVRLAVVDLAAAVRHSRIRPKGRRRLIQLDPVHSLVKPGGCPAQPVPMQCRRLRRASSPRSLTAWAAGIQSTVLANPRIVNVRAQAVCDRWIGSWVSEKGCQLPGTGMPPALGLQTRRRIVAIEVARYADLDQGVRRLRRCQSVLEGVAASVALVLITDANAHQVRQMHWRQLIAPPIDVYNVPKPP